MHNKAFYVFLRPGGWYIFTPQLFSFYIWTRKATAHLMHIFALALTSLTALLTMSSSRDSTKSLTTSWSSPRLWGLTLRISWSQMPRRSSYMGPRQGYAPAMHSPCCQRSLASQTSPGSTRARDYWCGSGTITTVGNNWGVKISQPPGLKKT